MFSVYNKKGDILSPSDIDVLTKLNDSLPTMNVRGLNK